MVYWKRIGICFRQNWVYKKLFSSLVETYFIFWININLFGDIFGVNKQLADLLINKILNSQEFYYDEQSALIHVRLIQ